MKRDKPHIHLQYGLWLCGGIFTKPHYMDWFSGRNPEEAYNNWKKGTTACTI